MSEPTHATASTGGAQSSTTRPGGRSDRILGLVCLGIAIWYTVEARTFDGTAFGSGPVGPKTIPTGVGIIFGILSLFLIARPDPEPRWPSARAGWQIALVVLCSYLYGQIMEPVGFIIASAMITIVIGLLFRAPPKALIPLAIALPVVLAFIFNNLLELQLPAGWWGGF